MRKKKPGTKCFFVSCMCMTFCAYEHKNPKVKSRESKKWKEKKIYENQK